MGVKHARCAGQGRRYGKGQELILRHIDSHRLRRDAVVADRHDRPSGPGIDQVHHDKQRHQNQNHADQEGGIIGRARNSLRSLDDDVSALLQSQRNAVLGRHMETAAVASQVNHIHYVFDNLSKGQRHDGQIVALQAQNRDADQDSEQSRAYGSNQNRQEKADSGHWNRRLHTAGEKRAGKGAHTHEARVSQAQLTGDTYRQVQRYRQDHIHAKRNQKSLQKAGYHARS